MELFRKPLDDYSIETINTRVKQLEENLNINLDSVHKNNDFKHLEPNIEHLIGFARVPIGVVGPIQVKGTDAKGSYFVPFATTEGALVKSYHRGIKMLNACGGVSVIVHKNLMHITPAFIVNNVAESYLLKEHIQTEINTIYEIVGKLSNHTKLKGIEYKVLAGNLYVMFQFDTADAMGQNTINILANEICSFISSKYNYSYILRSNYSSDKKPSFHNNINGYGKSVSASCLISKEILNKYYSVTVDAICNFWQIGIVASTHAGAVYYNSQLANGLAAIFIACGQDVAQILNSAAGNFVPTKTASGDLLITIDLPSLVVGTVGGGTNLPTQKQCLELMTCYGNGNSIKFAEIIAATLFSW